MMLSSPNDLPPVLAGDKTLDKFRRSKTITLITTTTLGPGLARHAGLDCMAIMDLGSGAG